MAIYGSFLAFLRHKINQATFCFISVRLIIREMKREGGKWKCVHILKHHMYLFLQRLGANLAFSQEKMPIAMAQSHPKPDTR